MLKRTFFIVFICFVCATLVPAQSSAGIEVRFSETYELANVILALTPYGISDPWEVQKGTPYYEDVMSQFKFMQGHPLLEKANYSREKWEDYLSFRTDAFAFEIDEKGKIVRRLPFFANNGHKPFDDNLALIQDFYEKSKFHEFYQQHLPYFQGIAGRYKDYFMVEEMQEFLTEEFGASQEKGDYLIICSPLVNRMNCHRKISQNTTADFPSLALSLILPDKGAPVDQEQRAVDIHLLFTELNHGYVNPVSDQYAKLLRKSFHYKKWDTGSGYKQDCFNEYMTWAVYDLFTLKYFPQYADQVNRDWHFQNNSRGFNASGMFGRKLQALYARRAPGQHIKDLYSELLNWTKNIQTDLKMPVLVQDTLVVSRQKINAPVTIQFTEIMQKMPVLDCVLFKVVNGQRERLDVLALEAGKTLNIQDKALIVNLPELPNEPGLYGLSFNLQGRKYELAAANGAAAPTPTRAYIRVL